MTKRPLSTLLLAAIGLVPSLASAGFPDRLETSPRRIAYVGPARYEVSTADAIARTTPMLSAGHFYLTAEGSSFTLWIDDATLFTGEPLSIRVRAAKADVFNGCLRDSVATTFPAVSGREYSVALTHSWCASTGWPSTGLITVEP